MEFWPAWSNYIPREALHGAMNAAGWFAVPVAVLFGVPMCGSCAAIVPVAVVLFQKGVPLGTALAFMMAIAALSLPEAIMLRRVMRLKLIAIFFGVTTLAIILAGYLLNALAIVLLQGVRCRGCPRIDSGADVVRQCRLQPQEQVSRLVSSIESGVPPASGCWSLPEEGPL